jgi:hypothetical protein
MKNFKYAVLFSTCIFLIVAETASAQQANFTGHWVLNESKSDFAGQPAEVMFKELIVKQSNDSLRIAGVRFNARDAKPSTITYPLNGNKITIDRPNNQKMEATLSWDSDHKQLVRNSRYYRDYDASENIYLSKEVWSLSADKHTLTLNRLFTIPTSATVSVTAVYELSKD